MQLRAKKRRGGRGDEAAETGSLFLPPSCGGGYVPPDPRMKSRAFSAVVCAVAIALGSLLSAAPAASSQHEHFITRRGARLYDGDKVFRFVGANLPGINLPYDFTLGLPERMGLPTP